MTNPIHEIKKSISFVFIENDEKKIIPNGTGFFVSIPNEIDSNQHHIYFVTAKHVLKDKDENFYKKIILRLNKKTGESEMISIDLSTIKIFEHTDKDVDIALFQCVPDTSVYDFKTIPIDLFATDQKIIDNSITEGDDVFFTGLFTSHVGQKKNQPIVRFGKVALISDEKIEWKEANKNPKLLDLFLIEASSFGGNSGSPAFFNLSPMRTPGVISIGGSNLLLAGLVSGSFLHGANVQMTQAVTNLFSTENVGICAVVPCQKLFEVLQNEELLNLRKTDPKKKN